MVIQDSTDNIDETYTQFKYTVICIVKAVMLGGVYYTYANSSGYLDSCERGNCHIFKREKVPATIVLVSSMREAGTMIVRDPDDLPPIQMGQIDIGNSFLMSHVKSENKTAA